MKLFIQFLLILCLFFYSFSSFAGPAVSCPPKSVIANAKFINARKAFDYHWEMLSRDLIVGDYRWNVYLLIKLPNNVTTSADALKFGQAYFASQVRLGQPVPLNDTSLPPTEDYPLTCSYNAGASNYGVLAQSPPMK